MSSRVFCCGSGLLGKAAQLKDLSLCHSSRCHGSLATSRRHQTCSVAVSASAAMPAPHSSGSAAITGSSPQQQQQQQQQQQELPSLLQLVSLYGARLTTAAQMVWAQVLQPGDVAVDATCGNGHDTLFMAQRVGPCGAVYAIDLQESAVASTRQLLQQQLPADASPQLHLLQGCHSQLQELVGSNLAKLVAFNLGYLPGGDKGIVTSAGSTVAAVEAALEVVCPGGLVSIMCYIGHPGGLEEYEQVRSLLAGLSPSHWTSSELKLVNRPTAPVMLLLWRRTDVQQQVSR
ncbi:putative rRNA methylase-domain-containing protein [Scenedesmus sp. NREL 46B-D3]|nr:putative rRNA methylase-domain-containing protein [Scenedesmus sp. NREL 46B-D3]